MHNQKHIHLIGLSGIGMSAIAHILLKQGYIVSGCDVDISHEHVKHLAKAGCAIQKGHNHGICHDASINTLVYSTAIPKNHAELKRAASLNIRICHRSIMLAEILKQHATICVSGSHGKTTTSSLLAHILLAAKHDPMVVVGGIINSIESNSHYGTGTYAVVEADESDRSFLNLIPHHTILTNISLEHLETYRDIDDIIATFSQFINKIPANGKAFVCLDSQHAKNIYIPAEKRVTYSVHSQDGDFYATNIQLNPYSSTFQVYSKHLSEALGYFELPLPGIHNVSNTLACIACAHHLGIDFEAIKNAIKSFKGVQRRFSFHGTFNGAWVFDDYGHHPNEIAATITVAKAQCKNKLVVIFQPHRYTRTQHLWNDFLNVLSNPAIDKLVITDIYAASESPISSVASDTLVHNINTIRNKNDTYYIPYQDINASIHNFLEATCQPGDTILFLGAGALNTIACNISKK